MESKNSMYSAEDQKIWSALSGLYRRGKRASSTGRGRIVSYRQADAVARKLFCSTRELVNYSLWDGSPIIMSKTDLQYFLIKSDEKY